MFLLSSPAFMVGIRPWGWLLLWRSEASQCHRKMGNVSFSVHVGPYIKEVQPQETLGESFPCPVSSSHRCGLSSVAEGGTLHALWERENCVWKSFFGCVYIWRFPSLDSHLPLPRIFFPESHEGQAAFFTSWETV